MDKFEKKNLEFAKHVTIRGDNVGGGTKVTITGENYTLVSDVKQVLKSKSEQLTVNHVHYGDLKLELEGFAVAYPKVCVVQYGPYALQLVGIKDHVDLGKRDLEKMISEKKKYPSKERAKSPESSVSAAGSSQRVTRSMAAPKVQPVTFKVCKYSLHISVHVLEYDITQISVDAIVTSANRGLQHQYGSAKVIVEAAGWDVNKECRETMRLRNNKPFDITDTFISQPGQLSCKSIIHVIIPTKDRGLAKYEMVTGLVNVFREATRRNYGTLALPTLGASK